MSRRYGVWQGLVVLALLLAGCGSRHVTAIPAAKVNGQPISWRDLRTNVNYAARFYAAGAAPSSVCTTKTSALCTALGQQVLGRLIEERVVQMYASRHHITLSPADRRRATQLSKTLLTTQEGSGAPTSRKMLISIVQRELLVQRVEEAVTASVPDGGPSYQLRRYIVPAYASRQQAYRAARRLAKHGKPVPPGTQIRTLWKSAFRLPADLHRALQIARPGQYVGPFPWPGGYEVVQFMQLDIHSYSKATRGWLISRRFTRWLEAQLRAARPVCFRHNGQVDVCPLPTVQAE